MVRSAVGDGKIPCNFSCGELVTTGPMDPSNTQNADNYLIVNFSLIAE